MSIEFWIILIIGLAFAFYSAVTILLMIGLGRIQSHSNTQTPLVSVIVAARNEEESISRLLESLVNQSYASYEIIVVDDDSTDRTVSIVQSYAREDRKLKVIPSDRSISQYARKKAALTTGILASNGEILCFTDADCLPGRNWISALVNEFTENIGLVAGYSPYDKTLLPVYAQTSGILAGLFQHFIRYEELKGAVWSAGSIGLGKGWLCTGRNLAYRRDVWNEVDGFAAIMKSISGDDDLFLQHVRRSTDWEISYTYTPTSFVPTAPPVSFRRFIEQRKRHFSAGKLFSVPMKLFFSLFHGSNLLLFLGFLAGLIFPSSFAAALAFFFTKIIIDLILINKGGSIFLEEHAWVQVIHMELLCLFYNTFIGPLGFITGFEWKPDLRS